jgi:hypothetical protein
MSPSKLAAELKQKLAHFEEDWDPEDVKSLAEFVIENGTALLAALTAPRGPNEKTSDCGGPKNCPECRKRYGAAGLW